MMPVAGELGSAEKVDSIPTSCKETP